MPGAPGADSRWVRWWTYLRRNYLLILFLLPSLLVVALTSLYPLAYSLVTSFYEWNLIKYGGTKTFVGLLNYVDVVHDSSFRVSLANTFRFAFASVSLELVLGFGLALIMAQEWRGMRPIRSIFLVPMILAPVVVGVLWRMLLHSQYGFVNYLFTRLGFNPQPWLADARLAMLSVILVDVWEWTPFVTLVMVAGLKSLPTEAFEVAQIDGASRYQIFRYITVPMLGPVIVATVLLRLMDAFKVFDTIYVLTQGGPGQSTEVMTSFIYKQGLKFLEMGYAAAASWVFLLIVFIGAVVALYGYRGQLKAS